MTDCRIEHILRCTPETFWSRVFSDPDYNRELFVGALGARSFTFKSSGARRVVGVVPRQTTIPAPLHALIGGDLGFTETGSVEAQKARYEFHVTPSRLAEKLKIRGALYTLRTAGQTLRVVELTVAASVVLLGQMLEERIIAQLTADYAAAATFTNRWLAERNF